MYTINPIAVDMSDMTATQNGIDRADFTQAWNFGIRAIIHRATQGAQIRDTMCANRLMRAQTAGMLFAVYHLMTGTNEADQIANFKSVGDFTDFQIPAIIDWEFCDERFGGSGIFSDVKKMVDTLDDARGRATWLMGGNLIKTYLTVANDIERDWFARHPLILTDFANQPVLQDYQKRPLPWNEPLLWKFTGDGVGPGPKYIPGIGPKSDVHMSPFETVDLTTFWRNGVLPASDRNIWKTGLPYLKGVQS